jgi:hypothetical protein
MGRQMQEMNEALIRLMLAARYQDRRITIAEEDEFDSHLESIDWDSGEEIDFFIMKETAVVRKVLESEDLKVSFVRDQCSKFISAEEKQICLKTLEALIRSDGIDIRENDFLKLVENELAVRQ